MNIQLSDDWMKSGKNANSFERFKNLIYDFSQSSTVFRIKLNRLRLLFFCGEIENKGTTYFRFAMPAETAEKDIRSVFYKKDDFLQNFGPLFHELAILRSVLYDTKTKQFYFISRHCMNSLIDRAGIRGDVQKPTLYRNLFVSQKFMESDEEVQLVLRKDENIQKAFGMFSSQYQYISQNIMMYIVNALKCDGYMLNEWRVSHLVTQVDMIGKEEIQIDNNYYRTGFQIVTSDTGYISFSIYPTLYIDGQKVILDISNKVQIPHRKSSQDENIEIGNRAFDKLMSKIEDIVEYGIYLFSQTENSLREMSHEKIGVENKEEMIAYAATLVDEKEMSKILGKKTFVNSLKETVPEDVRGSSKADAIFHVMRTSYKNQEDFVSTLRYNHFKNLVNSD